MIALGNGTESGLTTFTGMCIPGKIDTEFNSYDKSEAQPNRNVNPKKDAQFTLGKDK